MFLLPDLISNRIIDESKELQVNHFLALKQPGAYSVGLIMKIKSKQIIKMHFIFY